MQKVVNGRYQLGQIDAKLDLILEELREHKKRINWLERKANWAMGVMAALVFIWTLINDKVLATIGLK